MQTSAVLGSGRKYAMAAVQLQHLLMTTYLKTATAPLHYAPAGCSMVVSDLYLCCSFYAVRNTDWHAVHSHAMLLEP